MKKQSLFFALFIIIGISTVFAQNPVIEVGRKNVEVTITNPSNKMRIDEPVVIELEDMIMRSATVWDKNIEIPCQLDDLDANKTMDELAFVVTLKPNETKKLRIELSIDSAKSDRYPARVHAQMFKKEKDKSLTSVTNVSADGKTNIYNDLHHHGPAFESDLIAYRIYFDQKQTVDLYGKKQKRLELAETMWYPTDEQLKNNYGDDILLVGGSVSVGTLKPWNGQKATHITPVDMREARIIANGPVRTIVDMGSYGWEYSGQKITMISRYTMYAGHRDVEVSNIIFEKKDGVPYTIPNSVPFCTGVQKMPESEFFTDNKGLLGIWGTDYPVNDTIKYGKETVGLAVYMPQEYIVKRSDDNVNYLLLLNNNDDFQIKYYITAAAKKEEFGYKTSKEFFDYLTEWKKDLMQPIEVKIEK